MHIHLLVPDLLPGLNGDLRLEAAELLMARGRRSSEAAQPEAWLKEQYGMDVASDAGAAAWSLLGEGMAPGEACWVRADPVHLRVDRDALMLADSTLFGIERQEAADLSGHLDAHFAPRMHFLAPHPQRWYVRTEQAPGLACTPLAEARGLPISEHLPTGADAMRWHALMNEAQMALHEHPVNEAREARGEMPVNGVWFWGSGPLEQPAARPFDRVLSNDPLARGLAQASGATAMPLPADATALAVAEAASGQVLVVLDGLRAPSAYGDGEAWSGQASALERLWFAPLLAALRAGRIGMLTLHLTASADRGLAVETVAGDLRRFWRRPKPLSAYLPGAT
jgi:hypothetical protein